MQAAEAPSCTAREILRARLRADLKVYADAIEFLQRNLGKEFEKAHQGADRARRAYQVARRKLADHMALHGCG